MAMILQGSIVGVLLLLLMLLLILLLILLACKPWRFFSSLSSPSRALKVGDLERPLVLDDANAHGQSNESTRSNDLEGACGQNEGLLHSPRMHDLVYKQRLPSASLQLNEDPIEDLSVGQTIRFLSLTERLAEVQTHVRQEDQNPNLKNDLLQDLAPKAIADQRSCLSLEVISGPSCGLRCSVQPTSASRLPLTLGRVSSDLLLKDSEVSGKHAMINWNADKNKWELVDMGSLNGTFLNSQLISHPDSGSRHRGDPVELSSGDIITLGTTSNVHVHVTSKSECQTPFGIGIASDPMAFRRGGKKLAMEDVCYYQWPLPGIPQFGVFGICDGHGGVAAAKSASKMLPEKVASILSDSLIRERVLSQCDASDVLRVAFYQTEANMNNYYEGCAATVLLVWADSNENLFAQCANVGDSACFMNVDGKQIKMTEDHRVSSYSERLRLNETGVPLRDGETRLYGLNLARMLGDKFLKQQEPRFSSEPYISEAIHINQESGAFALLASDGFWDVISLKKAAQLVTQAKERYFEEGGNISEKVANFLLSEAKTLRTKDNTSILFLEFDRKFRISCKVDS
ncbi:protein phosphatase 2C 70 isoform X2 [Populus trichocarpa]|uniref:protein phosphatase 2C 70 isoform X2 n=1 Tax=Populus trichocarpa TaxID=3694 RepID=UPI0001D4B517|nr:protein phosphatase 2C 70 isoform X2 [Populus trichocarpa]|eukprot:XP_024463569.1 protein phosphatase 2C 70 isoform X2 [Populus trichocarpa]